MKARPFASFSVGFILSTLSLQAFNACAAETKPAKAPQAAPAATAAPAGDGGSAPEEKPKTQAEINAELMRAIKEGDPEQLMKDLQKATDDTKISSELAFAEERKLRDLDTRATQADFDRYRLAFSRAQEAQKKENEMKEKVQRIMVNRGKALKPFLDVKP